LNVLLNYPIIIRVIILNNCLKEERDYMIYCWVS